VNWDCCWTKEIITPEECPQISDGDEELYRSLRRRVVERCVECPSFRTDLQRLGAMGYPMAGILPFILDAYIEQKGQLDTMASFVDSRSREIDFFHELVTVLQSSLDLDEVISVAMTAITAGKGFGMNRAFLLLVNKERSLLEGTMAVGPRSHEEAWQTWAEIERHDLSLREMASNFRSSRLGPEKAKFADLLQRLQIPLDQEEHIINRSLSSRRSLLIENAFEDPTIAPGLLELLGSSTFAIIPLISRNRRIGVIIADNYFTHRPITARDLQSMETFSIPVALAIERTSLYERLQEQIDQLTEANQKLKEQQELIVRMEKMALVGRITSTIAHSIRNPLMVIGGFARTLLKGTGQEDPNREYLETIVHESKQLEDVLSEVLVYSDSLYPSRDRWDVNQLIETVCRSIGDQMTRNHVTCRLHLADGLPLIHIDFKQVSYCLRTIVASSVDAMKEGGELVISSAPANGHVRVEIIDQSPEAAPEGIIPMSPQEFGGGLGYSLCATIFEKNGIPFDINYEAGRGRRFQIRFPLPQEESHVENSGG
jgi:signal transduction histidine kinase